MRKQNYRKMYLVPCLLISVSAIFYGIPHAILLLFTKDTERLNFSLFRINLLYWTYISGFIADALIYIFLDEKVRKYAISTILFSSNNLNQVNHRRIHGTQIFAVRESYQLKAYASNEKNCIRNIYSFVTYVGMNMWNALAV